ncbi:hypothetical protein Tco_0519767 [Tanacetum coccineum]
MESCITIYPPAIRDTITTPIITIHYRDDIPKADMPLQKRACFTAPTSRYEVGESSSAVGAWQNGYILAYRVDYGFVDTSIRASESRAMTSIGEVNDRVVDLATLRGRMLRSFMYVVRTHRMIKPCWSSGFYMEEREEIHSLDGFFLRA